VNHGTTNVARTNVDNNRDYPGLEHSLKPLFTALLVGDAGGICLPGQTLRFDVQAAVLESLQAVNFAAKCVAQPTFCKRDSRSARVCVRACVPSVRARVCVRESVRACVRVCAYLAGKIRCRLTDPAAATTTTTATTVMRDRLHHQQHRHHHHHRHLIIIIAVVVVVVVVVHKSAFLNRPNAEVDKWLENRFRACAWHPHVACMLQVPRLRGPLGRAGVPPHRRRVGYLRHTGNQARS
jgi:hypothetical protein